jgi:hypothetical protein
MRGTPKYSLVIYPGPGHRGIESKVDHAVRGLCQSRKVANGLEGKRVPLNGEIVDKLVQRVIYAASHAASGSIANRVRGRGAPPDNARIILAGDVLRACKDVGISPGLRFVPPESFAVDLFNAITPIIWPTGTRNPRKTFDRLWRAKITWK